MACNIAGGEFIVFFDDRYYFSHRIEVSVKKLQKTKKIYYRKF